MINEVIRVTHKIMVSVSIYHSIQSMNMAYPAIGHGNLEQKFNGSSNIHSGASKLSGYGKRIKENEKKCV